MKKILFLITLMIFGQHSMANIRIFACEPEWAALATTLGGETVEVYSATTAQQDPHTIQARPGLIAQARQADLLICSGAELEVGWLPLLLQKSANPNIQANAKGYFMASDYIELLEKGHVADRSAGDVHLAGNPHIHTNPYNMLKIADALLPVLIQQMPEKATLLQANHAVFTRKMQAALTQWQALIHPLKGKNLVVHHDNWIYLRQWLQLNKVGTLEPKPGIPPTAGHLSSLLMQLKDNPADLIIYTAYQDKKPALWLSTRTGIPAKPLPATINDWKKTDSIILWYEELLMSLNRTTQ